MEQSPRLFSIPGGKRPVQNVSPEVPAADTLELGSTGPAVVALQTNLKKLGFDPGQASGEFDTETENAVKALQHKLGIEETGVFDATTKNAANNDLKAQTSKLKAVTSLVKVSVPNSAGTPSSAPTSAPAPVAAVVPFYKTPAFWAVAGAVGIYLLTRPKVEKIVEGIEVEGDEFEMEEEEAPKKRKPRKKKAKAAAPSKASEAVVDVTPEATPEA